MDVKALAVLLFLTIGAAEQRYGPYPRPAFGGAHSIASARGHVLLAWTQATGGHARVHVVLLDSSGRAVSPISILPALNPTRDAVAASVGTDGVSFLVVWEESWGMQQTVAMAVDANGVPAGDPHRLTSDVPVMTNDYAPARVHWSEDSYVILSGTRMAVRAHPDGTLREILRGVFPEAVSSDGTFGRTAFAIVNTTPGYPGQREPWPPIYKPAVFWYAGPQSWMEIMPSTATKPFITAVGTDFLIAWAVDGTLHYRVTNGLGQSVAANVNEFTRMDADCGTTRCVLAYSTNEGDVEALIFAATAPSGPTARITVASSDAFEGEPSVAVITDARALVTWRSTSAAGEHLAGRPLSLPVKQRTVR